MIWMRRLHKWIGLVLGLQVALWMLSGFMMGWLDHEKVQGMEYRAVNDPVSIGPAAGIIEPHLLLEQNNFFDEVSTVDLVNILGRPLYRVTSGDGVRLLDATDGTPFAIDEQVATIIAETDYAGPGSVSSVSPVDAPMIEIRKHSGPAWRVDFDDDEQTAIYVSARDGSILERRTDTWRLFDIFWMLHIMDYAEREDFNNLLVIVVGLVAAFFSITGVVLLLESFNKEDFLALLPGGGWRKSTTLTVCGPSGEVLSRIDAMAGRRLYDALAHAGIVLPSSCGGGGTCGLCEVSLAGGAPVTSADLRLIPEARLARGGRLSCQAKVTSGVAVTVSRESLNAKVRTARVADARCLTPFIREIVLELDDDSLDYRAGSYVHVIVPPHRIELGSLDVPSAVRRRWGEIANRTRSVNNGEVRRAYSLATAAPDNPGRLVLNVRLMLPEVADAPAGAGSTYMWSLKRGDCVELVAPLGEFHAEPGSSAVVVIGGGAGMAPLRAIIRDQLLHAKSGRQIDFWYGARARRDLFYDQELDTLQAAHANFRWQPVLSEAPETDDWTGPAGYVHRAAYEGLLKGREDLANCLFLICGPPPMLAATRGMLSDLGVPTDRVLFDDFGI